MRPIAVEAADLTVDEAYAKRKRKRTAKPEENAAGAVECKEDIQRLRNSITSIGKQAEHAIHDAAFAASEEAAILIPAVRKAIRELEELLKFLEQQAGASPEGAETEKPESEESPGSAT